MQIQYQFCHEALFYEAFRRQQFSGEDGATRCSPYRVVMQADEAIVKNVALSQSSHRHSHAITHISILPGLRPVIFVSIYHGRYRRRRQLKILWHGAEALPDVYDFVHLRFLAGKFNTAAGRVSVGDRDTVAMRRNLDTLIGDYSAVFYLAQDFARLNFGFLFFARDIRDYVIDQDRWRPVRDSLPRKPPVKS